MSELKLCSEHIVYKFEIQNICKGCKVNWWNCICIFCAEPWRQCLTCCKYFAFRKCFLHHFEELCRDCPFCELQIHCEKMYNAKLQITQNSWSQTSFPIVSCFLNRIGKCFSSHIVTYLTTFLSAKDGCKLATAIIFPLLCGHFVFDWSPFSSLSFFNGFANYFKIKYPTFELQGQALLRLNKKYLFELFTLKNFRQYFPSLVSLSQTYSKIMKDSLPTEFLEFVYKDYEKRYSKTNDKHKKFFETSLYFFELYLIVKNREILVSWKKSNPEISRLDIQDFVKKQRLDEFQKIQEKNNLYLKFQALLQEKNKK